MFAALSCFLFAPNMWIFKRKEKKEKPFGRGNRERKREASLRTKSVWGKKKVSELKIKKTLFLCLQVLCGHLYKSKTAD